jgi:hypothetical protein
VPGVRLLPVVAIIEGTMLSLAVFLTDLSLHNSLFVWTPPLAAILITGAVALTLQAFRRGWLAIFGRIFGSWLVAVGLLYGGT